MDPPCPTQIAHDLSPFFRVYTDGRVERLLVHDFQAASSTEPENGVVSRDVVVSPENHVSVRIFLPIAAASGGKLPLLIYIHGGAFSVESAFSTLYHNYVNSLASESRSIVVSIEYRLAPEHLIPACYEDCYAAVKWVGSHAEVGPDPWLNKYADFGRVFITGDSAGANISHDMVVRGGVNFKFSGLILVHPFFGIGKRDRVWDYICPDTSGVDDPRLHPMAHVDIMRGLESERILVCVAEKDFLRSRGERYYEAVKGSGWKGLVDWMETEGEDHVFHLFNRDSSAAIALMKHIVDFINGQSSLL